METHWKINQGEELLLFFTGWGMDHHPGNLLESTRFDICTCYDYRQPACPDDIRWQRYSRVTLVAWSMGIWAAEHILQGKELLMGEKIAINGTPYPVNDQWGIPEKIVRATHRNLSSESLHRFYRRMYGGETLYRAMSPHWPVVNPEERKEELSLILDQKDHNPSILWDKAILSVNDKIFPIENLRRYWSGKTLCREITAPHYPFHLYRNWEELTDD